MVALSVYACMHLSTAPHRHALVLLCTGAIVNRRNSAAPSSSALPRPRPFGNSRDEGCQIAVAMRAQRARCAAFNLEQPSPTPSTWSMEPHMLLGRLQSVRWYFAAVRQGGAMATWLQLYEDVGHLHIVVCIALFTLISARLVSVRCNFC